jgi:putative hydrolase of the HAD superfamily
LLHDLDKVTSRRLERRHGDLGGSIVRDRGHPDLARIVERHSIFSILDPTTRPAAWEEKLVYYADKIVEGDRIVGMLARVEALHRRYPEYTDEFDRCLPSVVDLEAEIVSRLGVSPQELLSEIRPVEVSVLKKERDDDLLGPSE